MPLEGKRLNSRSRLCILVSSITIAAVLLTCGSASGQSWQSECKITVSGNYRYIDSNGIPNHPTGQFPNRGNPNSISPQDYHRKVPVNPTPAQGIARGVDFGVAVDGVMFDPGTAELWNNDMRWHYEALTGLMASHGSLGMDQNFAHVQPTAAYHYHGLPMGLLYKLNYQSHMVLVGWAADGYPIYGPYCYSKANDPRSPLQEMKSGYRLKRDSRPGGSDGPGGACDGSFAQDYEWVRGLGDLDEFNGRYGVTPEFPNGTFYYVLTANWPFIPRMFKGEPDSSFRKGPPGGMHGGHFGPPPGGPPGRGFGPPGGGPPGGSSGRGFGPPQDR